MIPDKAEKSIRASIAPELRAERAKKARIAVEHEGRMIFLPDEIDKFQGYRDAESPQLLEPHERDC